MTACTRLVQAQPDQMTTWIGEVAPSPSLAKELSATESCWERETVGVLQRRGSWYINSGPVDAQTPKRIWAEQTGPNGCKKRKKRGHKIGGGEGREGGGRGKGRGEERVNSRGGRNER